MGFVPDTVRQPFPFEGIISPADSISHGFLGATGTAVTGSDADKNPVPTRAPTRRSVVICGGLVGVALKGNTHSHTSTNPRACFSVGASLSCAHKLPPANAPGANTDDSGRQR